MGTLADPFGSKVLPMSLDQNLSPSPNGDKLKFLAHPERFELPTNWFEASYSIQLSYGCLSGEASF